MKNLILLVVTVVVLFGLLFAVFKISSKPQAQDQVLFYQTTDQKRPRLSFNKERQDLGRMQVKDIKQAVFVLKNNGEKPLNIFGISSTCMCTFGQIEYQGEKSARFGMHANANYNLTLPPKESAKLHVIYQPSLMPVQGKVERAVIIRTNDPEKPEQYFGVTAYVE